MVRYNSEFLPMLPFNASTGVKNVLTSSVENNRMGFGIVDPVFLIKLLDKRTHKNGVISKTVGKQYGSVNAQIGGSCFIAAIHPLNNDRIRIAHNVVRNRFDII